MIQQYHYWAYTLRKLYFKKAVHKYNGILLCHKKNEFESAIVRWMKLELVMQNEISQKEKKKYVY